MSATLPLPLELTRPIELSSSLEVSLKEEFEFETTKYNPETQVREYPEGVPMILNGGTSSSAQCNSFDDDGLVQIDADVNVDDNDIL